MEEEEEDRGGGGRGQFEREDEEEERDDHDDDGDDEPTNVDSANMFEDVCACVQYTYVAYELCCVFLMYMYIM